MSFLKTICEASTSFSPVTVPFTPSFFPALKFLIAGHTVTLTGSTTFVGGTCSDIVAGKKLGVKGTVTGEKLVLASQIVFKNDN